MTIGIYALYWEEQDLIYIGQSQNIEVRYREHFRLMLDNKHTNYKVQNTYNLYGNPIHQILEICKIDELNQAETYWTNEFNSLNSGLNIVEPGLVGWGTNSNASKFSRRQVLRTFSYLYSTTLSYSRVAVLAKVSKSLVQDIASSDSHLWLREVYPKQYTSMLFNKLIRQQQNKGALLGNKGLKIPHIRAPDGRVFSEIVNITEFCKNIPEFSINLKTSARCIARIIDGTRKQYKGWTVLNTSMQLKQAEHSLWEREVGRSWLLILTNKPEWR